MAKKNKNNVTTPTVALDYIKSSGFRCIRADGAIGGVTPNGHIHMAFYSERNAIPRRITHEITDHGKLGEAREIETRNSIVREMDIDVFMTREVAEAIQEWLGNHIKKLAKLEKERK